MTVSLNLNRFRRPVGRSASGQLKTSQQRTRGQGTVVSQVPAQQVRFSHPTQSYHHLRQKMKDQPGLEYSLFSQSAEKYVIQSGTEQNAPTQMDGALALVHTHLGSCQWSDEDVRILLAHVILNEGEEIEHTVLGEDGYLRAIVKVNEGQLNVVLVEGTVEQHVDELKQELNSWFERIKSWSAQDLEDVALLDLSDRVENLLPNDWKVPVEGEDVQDVLEKLSGLDLIEMLGEVEALNEMIIGDKQTVTLRGLYQGDKVYSLTLNLGEVSASGHASLHLEVEKTSRGEFKVVVKGIGGKNHRKVAIILFENSHIDWEQTQIVYPDIYNRCLELNLNQRFMRFVDKDSYYANGHLVLKDTSISNFLSKTNEADLIAELVQAGRFSELSPGESQVVTVRGRFDKGEVLHPRVVVGEVDNKNNYFSFSLQFCKTEEGSLKVVVQGYGKAYADQVSTGVFHNSAIDWSLTREYYPDVYRTSVDAELREAFLKFIDKDSHYSTKGFTLHDQSLANYVTRLCQPELIQVLKDCKGLGDLEPGQSMLVSLRGDQCGDEIRSAKMYLGRVVSDYHCSIVLEILKSKSGEVSFVIKEIRGYRWRQIARALFFNPALNWILNKELYPHIYQQRLEFQLQESFVKFIDPESYYIKSLTLKNKSSENFLSQLSCPGLTKALLDTDSLQELQPGEKVQFTVRGYFNKGNVKALMLGLGLNEDNGYFHMHFEVRRTLLGDLKLLVLDVGGGSHADLVFEALYQNFELDFSPHIFHKFNIKRTDCDQLIYQLSEFGRTELLNEIRRVQGKGVDEVVDVYSKVLVRAALNILDRYAQDYSERSWDDSDKRFVVAKVLGGFLTGYRMDRDLAYGVSQILQRSFELDRVRQIQTFDRVKRKSGDSPIAESGWENFSPDLQDYLLNFSASYYSTPSEAPAEGFLRNPFNQMLGAAYYTLVDQGLSDLSHEILLHVYYQMRREDSLSEFYDGYQNQSGYERDYAIYNVQQDLKGFEMAMSDFELDVEEPYRIVEGTVAGASRFMWNVVFHKGLQQGMVQTAQEVFPNHEFNDDDVLSERLPQALFFEVQGRLCAAEYAALTASSSFEDKEKVLKLFLGLGADSILAFKRGYGSESMRADFIKLLHDLKTNHPKEYKSLLEDHYVYEKNVAVDGEMTIQPVTLRLGDILEGLLKGLKLSDLSGALRYFRLNFDSDEDSEKVEYETDRIKRLLLEEGELSENDQEWLADLMDAYTRPPKGKSTLQNFLNPPKGSRWYEVHQLIDEELPVQDSRRSGTVQTVADHLLEVSL